jgi:cytochrome c5
MNRLFTIVGTFLLGAALLMVAQTSSTQSSPKPNESNEEAQTAKSHRPSGLSRDEAYKQNCTRCHNEVPKLDPKRTNTIMRHMRVRANLTKDEAQAILDYLTE